MNDLKFVIRQLLKNPSFTAVAVLTLALGIAAHTTIFSFVNALLLRPPPVVAHVRSNPQSALGAIRDVARGLDSRLSLSRIETLDRHLALVLFPARAAGLLLGVFGGVALLLAISGLFGVIAYSVSQRTREIGIRMALGARRGEVMRMVLRQGLWLSGTGVVLGLVLAFAATRFLQSLLLGVSPVDPVTFIAMPLLLIAVALVACLLPARRAALVEPMVALRTE